MIFYAKYVHILFAIILLNTVVVSLFFRLILFCAMRLLACMNLSRSVINHFYTKQRVTVNNFTLYTNESSVFYGLWILEWMDVLSSFYDQGLSSQNKHWNSKRQMNKHKNTTLDWNVSSDLKLNQNRQVGALR